MTSTDGSKSVLLGKRKYLVCSDTDNSETNGGSVRKMLDSTDLWVSGKMYELRRRLHRQGYLYIRRLISPAAVKKAQETLFCHLDNLSAIKPETPLSFGLVNPEAKNITHQCVLDSSMELASQVSVKRVTEASELRVFFRELFSRMASVFDYKWINASKSNDSVGFHMDSVYLGHQPRACSCWIPFTDIPLNKGGLVVHAGSNVSKKLKTVRSTYGCMNADKSDVSGTGWFTEDPEEVLSYGGEFHVSDYHVGDAVIMTHQTLHGFSVNETKEWSLSCDTVWQHIDQQRDPRWFGDNPKGFEKFTKIGRHNRLLFPRTMEEAKSRWGVLGGYREDV